MGRGSLRAAVLRSRVYAPSVLRLRRGPAGTRHTLFHFQVSRPICLLQYKAEASACDGKTISLGDFYQRLLDFRVLCADKKSLVTLTCLRIQPLCCGRFQLPQHWYASSLSKGPGIKKTTEHPLGPIEIWSIRQKEQLDHLG